MAEPFIGEIKMFGGNFAPRGYALCDGQLLPINTNQALFSILGTIYGGDGRTTFGLPDLRGRVAMHPGRGPGLTPRQLGQKSGSETVTLSIMEIPSHNHPGTVKVADQNGTTHNASDGYLGRRAIDVDANPPETVEMYVPPTTATFGGNRKLDGVVTNNVGGNQSHQNMQPYQCVNYIIALQGIFPSRN